MCRENPLLAYGEESNLIEFSCNFFLVLFKVLEDPGFPLRFTVRIFKSRSFTFNVRECSQD